jgi:hypothetical protein
MTKKTRNRMKKRTTRMLATGKKRREKKKKKSQFLAYKTQQPQVYMRNSYE